MIYDRTYVDIIKAKNIFTEKIQNFIELTADEQNTMNRAYFNLETLNRIVDKINLIWFYLEDEGISKVDNQDVRQWNAQEIFKINNFSNIKKNIDDIIVALEELNHFKAPQFRNAYTILNDNYTYTNLNNLEKLLYDIDVATEDMYKYSYVSLGDSIAAGHSIDSDWETNYGMNSQYGVNGNTFTQIVKNSYTDLIGKEIASKYGDRAKTQSFAHSGDKVEDLLNKIRANDYDNPVANSIRTANLVTISIGANNVLIPALERFDDYIIGGQQALNDIGAQIDANWGNFENLYATLLAELNVLNPKAKFIFTTVYNPYKYLWLEESTEEENYLDGFWGPLMWYIPHQVIGNEKARKIRKAFLNTDAFQTLYNRVNSMPAWVEKYVTKLNNTIIDKISALNNPNFMVADTKKVFESFPDRPISANKHYNDLVSVEFTRGFRVQDMDWEQFWENLGWDDILTNVENIASNIVNNVIINVIIPDIDPHPETYGQYVMKRAFEDVISTFNEKPDWLSLTRYTVSFNKGTYGAGTMEEQEVVGVDNTVFAIINPNTFTSTTAGYRFNGWNGSTHQYGYYYVWLNSDTELTAQWSNVYYITYRHTYSHANDIYHNGDEDEGRPDCYGLYINSVLQEKFGKFADGTRKVIPFIYGQYVEINVKCYNPNDLFYDNQDCGIYINGTIGEFNGNKLVGTNVYYFFYPTTDLDIEFLWKTDGNFVDRNARSWYDCFIVTQ